MAAQLTHASPRVISQVYGHLLGDDLDRAAAVFDLPAITAPPERVRDRRL